MYKAEVTGQGAMRLKCGGEIRVPHGEKLWKDCEAVEQTCRESSGVWPGGAEPPLATRTDWKSAEHSAPAWDMPESPNPPWPDRALHHLWNQQLHKPHGDGGNSENSREKTFCRVGNQQFFESSS